MKKDISHITLLLALMAVLITAGISSCSKDRDSGYAKVPAPDWKEDMTGKYPASMTAVVQLPENLLPASQVEDKLAAFIKDECRGTGVMVKVNDTTSVFYVMIHGTAAEQTKISFKYYSKKDSYLYTTNDFLDFSIDGNYGTVDEPAILDLQHVK